NRVMQFRSNPQPGRGPAEVSDIKKGYRWQKELDSSIPKDQKDAKLAEITYKLNSKTFDRETYQGEVPKMNLGKELPSPKDDLNLIVGIGGQTSPSPTKLGAEHGLARVGSPNARTFIFVGKGVYAPVVYPNGETEPKKPAALIADYKEIALKIKGLGG